MTEKEYRRHPAISRSELFKMSETPEKFKYFQENPQPQTPTLAFGSFLHKLVLEPETLWDEFCVLPNVDRRTKSGKQAFEAFVIENADKTIMTEYEASTAKEMAEAINKNPISRRLLQGEHEKPLFWTDEATGEECKCRVDCLAKLDDTYIVVDVKTTDNASNASFMRSAMKYGYHFQAGMYLEGVRRALGIPMEKLMFVFIAVEKQAPYAVNILQADELFIQRGQDLYRQYLTQYHECKVSGNWYGYTGPNNEINSLTLPGWASGEE